MTPAHELLLAYLRRANERCSELKTVADNLRSELNYARKSRDAWKEKAKARRLALKHMTASRDLWRHRAMSAAVGVRVVEVDVRPRVIARDQRDGLPPADLGTGGDAVGDVAQPVVAA